MVGAYKMRLTGLLTPRAQFHGLSMTCARLSRPLILAPISPLSRRPDGARLEAASNHILDHPITPQRRPGQLLGDGDDGLPAL
jgi:hypothetical protein